jgi:hypothetical protein
MRLPNGVKPDGSGTPAISWRRNTLSASIGVGARLLRRAAGGTPAIRPDCPRCSRFIQHSDLQMRRILV